MFQILDVIALEIPKPVLDLDGPGENLRKNLKNLKKVE
jgi:hypothetical protein